MVNIRHESRLFGKKPANGEAGKVQLYVFPFAGASFYSYNPVINAIRQVPENNLDIRPLELPGRGKRIGSPLLSDLGDMADDLFSGIRNELHSPCVFWGHSLGSILAYEVILRLLDTGCNLPVHLLVSGRRGPAVPSREKNIGELPREEFYQKLKAYGGTPEQILREKELMDLFEPVLRADFSAAAQERTTPVRKIPLAVTVMNGTQDTVTHRDCMGWQDITDSPIRYE
ncbi:MAG TPA: hypothetical protein DHV36_07770, partial [Desulfobacteraceae bacterium]|nr:hypothetical protein [Desulfobacteraceae bacterium]